MSFLSFLDFLLAPFLTFSSTSSRPPVHCGLLPSTLTHTRTVTDSADILVSSIPDISLLSNVRREMGEPSWLALMDDEGKERVIAERLSLSESRVLSFGRVRKKEKGGGEDKGGGKYRETRRELLGISRAR